VSSVRYVYLPKILEYYVPIILMLKDYDVRYWRKPRD